MGSDKCDTNGVEVQPAVEEDKGTGTQNRESGMGMKGYTWMKLGKRYQA